MKNPTPYDDGTRLEPEVWVKGKYAGKENIRRAEPDDYGKVDFDLDDGTTALTLWVELQEDGTYLLTGDDHEMVDITTDLPLANADVRDRARVLLAATYRAANGDSNDAEIEILQQARDLLADILRIDTTTLED